MRGFAQSEKMYCHDFCHLAELAGVESLHYRAMLMSTDAYGRAPYLYDAFVGHARVLRDRRWAEWLTNALENCSVPVGLEAKGFPLLRKVFRVKNEQSEAQLQDDVKDALKASRFLIVVCSRLTPGSKRIVQEIDLFYQLGRSDHVLAVLTEGEPKDALPAILLERHKIRQSDGNDNDFVADEGPLAADVRPHAGFSLTKIQRIARQRLTARIFGVPFAELSRIDARSRRGKSRLVTRRRRF